MRLFYNPRIYTSISDYTVGGFKTIKTNMDFEDIQASVEIRIRKAVSKFIYDERTSLQHGNPKQSTSEMNAKNNLAKMLDGYLGLVVSEDSEDGIADEIIGSTHFLNWINKIKIRCDEYKIDKKALIGVPTHVETHSADLSEEIEATEEIDLEQIVEILSGTFHL